jgi:hypothetical protein
MKAAIKSYKCVQIHMFGTILTNAFEFTKKLKSV